MGRVDRNQSRPGDKGGKKSEEGRVVQGRRKSGNRSGPDAFTKLPNVHSLPYFDTMRNNNDVNNNSTYLRHNCQ